MSRIAKWKLEKTKVKVVFRLQFNATNIPQTGWDKLFISLVPADSGKATGKTTKANVKNGTCKWADPIYETTRLLQDTKTKLYDEKLYKLVVAMGSPRSSLLGEAIINLADYADASKPSTVALPLRGGDAGTILHVTVQLLTSKTGFREFEQQRELRERGLRTTTDQNSHDGSIGGEVSSSEEIANEHIDRANARVRLKAGSKERPSLGETVRLNEEYADSAVGFDGSSNTSESLYAEKQDTSDTHEIDSLKSTISGDLGGLSLIQSTLPPKDDPSDHRFLAQGTNDWVRGWASDYSVDNDLSSAYEETNRLRGSLEVAESSIVDLKMEVSSLQSHADEIGVETRDFSLKLAAEIASGEELAKEVSLLKSECSKLKDDIERHNNSKLNPPSISGEASATDKDHLFENLRLRWLKGLLVMEDNIKQVQNKVCFGSHENDFKFLQSDFEALLGVLLDLKQETGNEISMLKFVPSERTVREIGNINLHESEQIVLGSGFNLDLYQPEGMLHSISIPGLVSHESDSVDATDAMKRKIVELLRESDESKGERESLAKKMDQMENYYEALVQELEENQRQMLVELQSLRNEHSTCLYTISSSKAEMETVRHDMNNQILRFSEEKSQLELLIEEHERRAINAEASLKRARLNYSIAVGQLQKDLELLSFQVLSMFQTNENLVRQAFADSMQPGFQGNPETMRYKGLDLKELHSVTVFPSQNQCTGLKRQQLGGGDMLLEDLKRSLQLQEELYQKVEDEVCEMHLQNVYLDVFSRALQETLVEASSNVRLMKKKMDELTQQLQLTTDSKALLMVKLQSTMDDVHSLNELNESCIAKCTDMALRNQILEENLQNITGENHLLAQKITEWEALLAQYSIYQSKYETCAAENTELIKLLKEETLENGHLQNEISTLKEELKDIKLEFSEMAYVKENLQNNVNFVQAKLWNLLASHDKKFNELSMQTEFSCQDVESRDLTGAVLRLEELQHSATEKILQLTEENKCLADERDTARMSLTMSESDLSNTMMQKLQSDIEAIGNRLNVSTKAEEEYTLQHQEILSDLDRLEVELEQVASKNGDLAQELSALDSVSKLTVAEFTEENQSLVASLGDKTKENDKLALEVNTLKQTLQYLHDELIVERNLKDKLENIVTDLTSQLNEKHCQLLDFDKQKAELVQFKQLVSDLELEKSRVCHLLSQSEECLRKVKEESSSLMGLEVHLSEMDEYLIAADVQLIFTKTHYESRIEELVQKLQSSDSYLLELRKKNLNVESKLDRCISAEAHFAEENAKLLKSLDSLRFELAASIAQNRVLLDTKDVIAAELDEYKNKVAKMEVDFCELASSEEEIENLMLSNEELEVKVVVLKAKLDEQHAHVTLLKGYKDELMMQQNQCNELTQRLSEQILKTQEFKNLSVHLKELKDKADAELAQVRDRKEPESPPVAVQESLRIAFIKEQYETRLQDLKHQLNISKKHSDEMLWKLQDTIDEVEARKKSEASHLKRNEELGMKILELEDELHLVVSERREKMNAYDRMKAEHECSLISLECCKEEKQKLEASLQEFYEEKSKMVAELASMKELLESYTSPLNIQMEGNTGSYRVGCIPDEPVVGKIHQINLVVDTPSNRRRSMNISPGKSQIVGSDPIYLNRDNCEAANACSIPPDEVEHLSALVNGQPVQDALSSGDANKISNQENVFHSDTEHFALINGHFKAESLRSSMDHLNDELERMKNENSVLLQGDLNSDQKFPGLPRELMQLEKVNKELGSLFPPFTEFSGSRNALERVLALEIELAESLQAKKQKTIHFQSSFLKQHSDEEAVFKSFSDINELIKDMLELKGRYTAVETELKEMHDRYSQLSLQFAEVEGERQKLTMTLKNVRATKNPQHLNRSSSASLDNRSL